MLLEVEQKFPVADLPAVKQSLADLGATFSAVENQADLYFAHPSRQFEQTDEALRIRCTGDENVITYKGPKLDRETKTRREIELPLPPGAGGRQQFAELLEVLGFRQVFEVRKRREPGALGWEGREVHLALDDVAGLGTFLELEILADQADLEASKACLASLARRLNLPASERRGYLDLLLGGTS